MHGYVFRLLFVVALLLGIGPVVHVAASQDDVATPLADLGYPELEIVLSAEGITQLPEEIEADRYRIVVTNEVDVWGGVSFIYLPEGVTEADVLTAVQDPSGPPEWFYTTAMPASLPISGVGSNDIIADLPSGNLFFVVFVWEGDFDPGGPQFIRVTGDSSAIDSAPVPASDVNLQLADMSFTLSGAVPAGTSTWEITNNGPQPHEVAITRAPDGTTLDQVLAINEASMSGGTPPPGGPNPEDFMLVGGVSSISSGTTIWTTFNLDPGTYVVVCYVTDPETGLPHMMLGMIEVFTVEEP